MLSRKLNLALMQTIVLSVMSCATHKQIATEIRDQEHSSVLCQTQSNLLLDRWLDAAINRNSETYTKGRRESADIRKDDIERVTEVYDTSRPVDSITGTPPLLSRTTERHKSSQESHECQQNDTEAYDSIAVTVDQNMSVDNTASVNLQSYDIVHHESESEEKREMSAWPDFLGAVIVLVVIAFATWGIRKI